MQLVDFMRGACVLLACVGAGTPLALAPQSGTSSKTTPLILEENEGERRVIRGWPGHPEPGETFILKVDAKNGGSSHLVFVTVDLGQGGEIPTHRQPVCRRNPLFPDWNCEGAFGRFSPGSPRGFHRVHPFGNMDFCFQHWERTHKGSGGFFLTRIRGLHARRIRSRGREKRAAVGSRRRRDCQEAFPCRDLQRTVVRTVETLRCYPVSARINGVANDDPECSSPAELAKIQDRRF